MESDAAQKTVRRFNLRDGLILIVGLSITLLLLKGNAWFDRVVPRARSWCQLASELLGASVWNLSQWQRAQGVISEIISEWLVMFLSSVLVGLTLAQPLIRLRHPRPPLRAFSRQSGFVACMTVIVATLVIVDLGWFGKIRLSALKMLGVSLVLLWPILQLPPWRAEPSWVDRLGRAVGVGWIIVVASGATLACL